MIVGAEKILLIKCFLGVCWFGDIVIVDKISRIFFSTVAGFWFFHQLYFYQSEDWKVRTAGVDWYVPEYLFPLFWRILADGDPQHISRCRAGLDAWPNNFISAHCRLPVFIGFFESTPGLFRTLSVHTRDSLSAGLEYGFQLSCFSPCSLVSWQHIY